MAGPKQRGRGKTKKRTYAKKDPTITRSWDEYWKKKEEEQARLMQRLPELAGSGYFKERWKSRKDHFPDLRDYRNRMSMQDIMGVPPSITMSDPAQQAFREEGFDRFTQQLIDRDKRGSYPGEEVVDWQKFRNQMNFRNMLLEPKIEEEGRVWGSYKPNTGIVSLSPDIFDYPHEKIKYNYPSKIPWHEYLHSQGANERAVRDILGEDVPEGYTEEQKRPLTKEEYAELRKKLGMKPTKYTRTLSLSRGGIASLPTRGIFY